MFVFKKCLKYIIVYFYYLQMNFFFFSSFFFFYIQIFIPDVHVIKMQQQVLMEINYKFLKTS